MTVTQPRSPATSSQYSISENANVLSQIYQPNTSLACFCQKASWALSQAAKKYASHSQGELLRFQGKISNELKNDIDQLCEHQTHGNLLSDHIKLMVDMFDTLFEPNEVGIRILSCHHQHSPAFHQSKMLCRMCSTLGGSGERWLTQQDAHFHPLVASQTTHQITSKSAQRINHFCDGDIAIYKGTHWLDHEQHALINASPNFDDQPAKICIYIDLLN